MPRRKRLAIGWLLGGTLFVVIAAFWFRQAGWRNDFSKWPPARVFRLALGQPPPSGVTDIQAVGRRYLGKQWVWLRFHATDRAMARLASRGTPLSPAEAHQLLRERWSADARYDAADRTHISWGEAAQIAHPVAYQFSLGSTSGWLWDGMLIFDHQKHTVFVQAHGD